MYHACSSVAFRISPKLKHACHGYDSTTHAPPTVNTTSSSSSPDSGPSPQSKYLIIEEASEVFDDPIHTFVDPTSPWDMPVQLSKSEEHGYSETDEVSDKNQSLDVNNIVTNSARILLLAFPTHTHQYFLNKGGKRKTIPFKW